MPLLWSVIFFQPNFLVFQNFVQLIISTNVIIRITFGTFTKSALLWKARALHGSPVSVIFLLFLLFFRVFHLRWYNDYRWNFCKICIVMEMPCTIRFAYFLFLLSFSFSKFRPTNCLHIRYFNNCVCNFRKICIIVEIQGITRFARCHRGRVQQKSLYIHTIRFQKEWQWTWNEIVAILKTAGYWYQPRFGTSLQICILSQTALVLMYGVMRRRRWWHTALAHSPNPICWTLKGKDQVWPAVFPKW